MVIPVPIVAVLFERGAFAASDTFPTALAVAVYGAGLPAFVMQKVISPLYYAREDTRSPFRYAVHAMIVNAAIALGLAPFIGFIAAALGTTVAGWVMLFQLWRGSRPMGDAAEPDARLRRAAPRIALACLVMGGVLVIADRLLAGALARADAALRRPRAAHRGRDGRLRRRGCALRRAAPVGRPRRAAQRPASRQRLDPRARGLIHRSVSRIRGRARPEDRCTTRR